MSTSVVEWFMVGADVLVAAVIYYELEEHRAAELINHIDEGAFYKERAELYEAYCKVPGDSLKERAENFAACLWEDVGLREKADRQWTYLSRLQYMVRHSLFHRSLMARWFPHVLICMWVMLGSYLDQRQLRRPTPVKPFFERAVQKSLKALGRHGFQPITIYSNVNQHQPVITVKDLESMRHNLRSIFK